MSNLTSVARDRLAKKAKAAENGTAYIEQAGKPGKSDKSASAEKQKRLNVDIPEGLHKALKQKALDDGVNVRALIIKSINELLK